MKTRQAIKRPSLDPRAIMSGLSAGLVIGILVIFTQVSLAALIFSGDLDQFLSAGIGILLFGGLILGIVVTLTSSISFAIAMPQDAPIVVLAGVAAAVASTMSGAEPQQILATVVATMMLSTILTGIFFWLIGRFNLGQLVRYVPYPVVGGFLAGTGWLIVVGAIGVMIDTPFGPALLQPEALVRWLPGLLLAFIIYFALRRYSHFLLMPALILAGVGFFYLALFLTDGSLESAAQAGWLLGPFPEGSLWQPVIGLVLSDTDWTVVAGQLITLSTILLVGILSLLMNASGVEITVNKDVDLNRELRSAGIANLLASFGGSPPGYLSLADTSLAYKLGTSGRLVGFVSAAVVALALIFGAGMLSVFPRVIAGSFLLFIGIAFLIEWVYDAYFKLSKLEYLLIWLILIVIAVFGFLEGVAVGIVVASVFFVFNYSHINVARHAITGTHYQSNVMRPPFYQELLHDKGSDLYILELQGYIFFGTAHNFLEQIRQRIEDPGQRKLRFLLLDFRLVTGTDSSATLSMQRLMQMVTVEGMHVVFTNLAQEIQAQWANKIFNNKNRDAWQIFPDLDQGVAWCEQVTIDNFNSANPMVKPKTLLERLDELLQLSAAESGIAGAAGSPETQTGRRMTRYVTRVDAAQNQCLLHQGSAVEGLYFVEEGQVLAKSTNEDGQELKLRTMETGTVFGEIGFYSHLTATADVVAGTPCVLIYLPTEKLRVMEQEDPQLALAFHRMIAGILAEKLAQTITTILALKS